MKATDLDDSCFQEHLIENEVSVLRQVKHPNIIMLIEEVDTSSELYLVMELVKVRESAGKMSFSVKCYKENELPWAQGGDLFDAITSSAKYTERDASIMVYNLAAALKYLHSLNIVHRDIKPENLLVCIAAAFPVSNPPWPGTDARPCACPGVRVSRRHQVTEARRLRSGHRGGRSAVHGVRNSDLRGSRDHRRIWVRLRTEMHS